MKTHVPVLPGAAIAALIVLMPLLPAQEAPPDKVKKHYDMLLKRPAPGYLFDRFCNGWLDTATLDDLEKFLASRAGSQGTTADHLLLAYFHARQANSVKAIAQFRIALEKDPGSADAWYQKAVVEARTLNFDTALTDLEKAAAAKPREEMELTIRQFQARLLIRSGKPDKAAEVFRALLAARPGDEELREDMIELEVAEGLMDEATAAAQELIDLTKDPQKKVLRRLRLGDILQRAGKREEAVDIYAATLADTGSDSWLEKEIISQIEQVFRREDDIAGLRDRLQRMIAAEPKRLALRLAQARMLTADGNAEAAMKAWQEILALTPGNRPLRETYIEQMAVLKKLPEAIAQMKELVAQHASDLELLPRLADLHFQNKDTAQCLAALQQFMEKSDKQEGAWLRTAALMERYSLSSDALALLEKASAALPESEAIAEAQAVTLHGMDKKAEAVAVWKKLASGKSRERTVQVARMATTRNEMEASFDILHARLADFEKDPLFLTELTGAAVRVKREAEALPWARQRIALTSDAADLEPALDDAVRIIMTLNKEQDVIRETTDGATPQELSLAAALHESLGNPKRAEELLGKVTAAMPELGGSLQVRLFMTRGEPVKAAEALKKVIELPEGRKTAAVQRLVDLYQRAGRLEDALTWTAEWKRLSPGAVLPWENEAHLLQLSGRSSDSLKTLRQAAQMFPENEDLKAGLARRYREDGRLADAQRLLEQLYEDGKDPGSKLKWVAEMAQTAEQQGRTKELVESFEERRRTNRASTLPLLALSEIYRTAGSYEERRAALLEAARLKPDDLDLLMEIARIEQTQGELASAQETLRKARQLDQGNRATQKLAEVLFASGKDEEAVKMMEEIDTAKRLDPAAVESLAMSVIGSGEWERAETFLRPLTAKYPDNYRLHYLYGLMLEESGQNAAAQELYLKMLGMEKELQGARPPKHREMYATLRRHVPEAAVQITDMINSASYAYIHRQSSGGTRYYTTSSGVTTSISSGGTAQKPYLPSDLHEMRTLTLQHLASLAQSMEEQAVAALKKGLIARGIVWAEYLTELNRRTSYGGNISPQIAALVKAAPQEDYALALLCLNMIYNSPDRYAPQMREAFARFRERHPQLAAMALLALLRHDDPADIPLLKDGVGLIAGIEQPIDQLSNSLSNVSWMASSENTSIKPERREVAKVIAEKLETLYAALPANSPARQQLQQSIFQACMNRHDWPRMFQLLEEELATALSSSTLSNAAYRNYYYNTESQFITEPPFPPRRLPQVPAMIANRWGLDDSGGSLHLSVPAEETDKFKAAVRACKEPAIRILVALRFGEESLIDEMLKAAREVPEPGAAVCTIMAGWHTGRSEPDKALEWLRRTQFLPLTRDDRAIVDRYLLGVITLGGLNPAPDTPDFTAARDAVVRLRQTKLDNPKREAMAAALTALGLIDDADKLLAANAAASRQSTPAASRASTASQAMDVKIEGLIKQGQKEKAMTLLLREMRMAARSATGGSSYRDADAMIRLTKRLNLKDEVYSQMKPVDGATTGLAEYGWLLTAFDDKDAGKQWYDKAVAARPRDLQLRLTSAGMYLTAEKPDVEAAWKLLEATPSDGLAGMDSNFMRFFGSRNGSLDWQMGNLEILRRFIEKHRKTPGLEWGWAVNALEASVQPSTKETITLPWLYNKPAGQKLSLTRTSKLKEWEAKRRTLHDDICRLMSEIPGLRNQAFQRLASVRLAEESDGDDLIAMAKEALLTKRDNSVENFVSYYYGYNEETRLFRPAPGDYLAEAAFKKGDRTILDSAAAELEKLDQADAAKLLRAQADLFFCQEAEFEVKARAQILPAKKEELVLGDAAVVRIWQKRKLPPLLNAVLLERMNQPESRRNGTASLPPDYLATLITTGHRDKAEAFLSEACAALLGPAEKRAELLKLNWNPRGYSPPGTPGYLIRTMRQLMIQAAQRDELAVLAMSALNDELVRYFDDVRRDDYYGGQLRPESSALRDWPPTQSPERMKRILDGSPFLADLPAWHPVAHPYNKGASVLAWMLKTSVRAGTKPAVRKDSAAVLNQFPDTLGRAILLAAAGAEKDEAMRRSVLDLLAARRSALESLPEERLAEIASFVKELAGEDLVKLKASAEATALVNWLQPKLPGSDDLAVFLKPPGTWDKPVASAAWQSSVRKALRLAAKESREKFHAVVARARSLRIQGLPGAVSPQPKHENSPLALAILSHLQESAADRKKPDDPAFWNSLIYAAEATLDPANDLDWDISGIDVQAQSAFGLLWRDCLKGRNKEEALTEFINRLAKVFTADQFRLYTQGFLNVIMAEGKDGLTPEHMKSWAAAPAATASPVARECTHLLAIEAARRNEGSAPPAAAVAAYSEHVLAVAREKALPPKARLTMTGAWLNHAYKFLPPEVCKEAAAMLLATWQARRSYDVRDAESVFRAILALPDAAMRQELLKPLLAATSRATCIRMSNVLDEQLVAAAVQCDDKPLLQRVAGNRSGRVHHGFLAAMLNEGMIDEARRWFEQNALTMGTKTAPDHAGWTPALAAKSDSFTRSLDSPHKSYLAEILLTMLPDTGDSKKRTEQTRARMIPLAKKFGSVPLPDAAWRDRILDLLATDDQVILEAAPALGALAEKEPLGVLARVQGQAPRAKLRVLHLWIVHEFKQRRFGAFEQFLSDLSARRLTSTYYSNSDDDPWVKSIRDTLKWTLHAAFMNSHEWSAEERAKLGGIYLAALQQKTYISDASDSEDVLQSALLYHAVTGQNDALEAWWKKIPEDQQKKTRERFWSSGIDIWLTKEDLDKRYGSDRTARLKFVKEYLANSVGLNGGDNCMDRPATIEWATRQEILGMAGDLLTQIPRAGDTGRQLAVVAEKERAWEQGAAILATTVQHLEKDRAKQEPRILLQRALMLLQAGKTQESLAETEKLRSAVLEPFKNGKVESDALSGLATWIETHGRALMAVGRKDDALAFLGINPSVQRLAVREAGGNLSDAALHESLFRYAEAKDGIKVLNLVAKESTWRFRDSPDAPPSNWNATDADDSTWASGPGKLGYGDPVRTSLTFGPDKNNKPLAAYFRTTFELADPKEAQSLHIGILRDDGCIVYLNGEEILRQNMPEGAVAHDTVATVATDQNLENEYFPALLPAEHLVSGKNVLAVEIHQATPTSTDLGFDLQLRANLPDPNEIMSTLDPAAIGPKLGDLWTALPEAVRKALE